MSTLQLNPLRFIDTSKLRDPIDLAVYDAGQHLMATDSDDPTSGLVDVTVRSSNWNHLLIAGKIRETYVAIYGRQNGINYQLVTSLTNPVLLLEEAVRIVLQSAGRPLERLVILDKLNAYDGQLIRLGSRDSYCDVVGPYVTTTGRVEGESEFSLLEGKLDVDLGAHRELEDAIRSYHARSLPSSTLNIDPFGMNKRVDVKNNY